MEYAKYTKEDAANDGIGYNISSYSTKLLENNEIVGSIVFEDTPLKIDDSIIEKHDSDEAKTYFRNINKNNSVLLRKITFQKDRYSGQLEDFFDYVTTKVVPANFIIWCTPTIWDLNGFVNQIGGFYPPKHELPNKNILIFPIDLLEKTRLK